MMSISALGKASGDKAQYCQSTASAEAGIEGYYQGSNREPAGIWQGAGLEAMGISAGSIVTDAAFANITRGYAADGSSLGVQGEGDEHRAGWDPTFSPPKTVSIAFAAGDAEMQAKIALAHDQAVTTALKFIEDKAAFCRRGKGGLEHEKLAGLVFATYQHCDTREGDPDLHTHALVMNLAEREDGTFGGIESKYLYEWQHASGAIYRAELAKNINELGFQVAKDRDFFKIKGISDDICKHFSKRRTQIETALEKAGLQPGNAKTSEIASLSTRAKKAVNVLRETLFGRWKTELSELGLEANKINEIASGKAVESENNDVLEFIETDEIIEKDPENLFEHLTQNESVFKIQDVYKIIGIRAQLTGIGAEGVEAEVQAALESSEIIKLGNGLMTTKRMLEIETKLVGQAQILRDRQNHGLNSETVQSAIAEFTASKGFSLSTEQIKGLFEITESGDLKMVRGAAGSGKSTLLAAAKIAYRTQGYKVIGMALSGKAASGLQDGSGIESSTIHKFLFDYEKGKIEIDQHTIFVMDESGMTGSELAQRVTDIAIKHNAKLILVGDERQLQSVSAGGAFKLIQDQLGNFSQLNEVRRQRNEADRDAANSIAGGEGSKALQSYIERNLIHVGQTVDTTRQTLVNAWLADTHDIEEKIIMAQTRNDVFKLNELARSRMNLAPGNIIKTATGEREISIGERIMITKNNSKIGVKNGHFATVQDMKFTRSGEVELSIVIDGQKGAVKLQASGHEAFNHFDHGYAATVHKTQGATVDSAYFYASAFSDKELSYVAMSRHRDQCQIFTPLSKLEEALDRVGIELNADELEADNIQKTLERLGKALEKSHQKATSLDHISHDEATTLLAKIKEKEETLALAKAAAEAEKMATIQAIQQHKEYEIEI